MRDAFDDKVCITRIDQTMKETISYPCSKGEGMASGTRLTNSICCRFSSSLLPLQVSTSVSVRQSFSTHVCLRHTFLGTLLVLLGGRALSLF